MYKKIFASLCVVFGLVASGVFSEAALASTQPLASFGDYTYSGSRLTGPQSEVFPQNNLTFWNPYECDPKGGGSGSRIRSDSCFKINSSVGAQDFWYGEGCLNTGDCTSTDVQYYAQTSPPKSDGGLTATMNNPWIYDDTKVDDDFGGLQYIYAENYDYEYGGSETKLTPNGGSSTRKYYWVALPAEAYAKGLGDTYVATFENLSEPVYFISFDLHACEHQSESYCDKALADPDGVEIGREFFGALSKDGTYQEAANKAGKLTSFCRINGTDEVLAASSGDASNITSAGGGAASTPSSDSSTPSSGSSTPSSDTSGAAGTTAGKSVAEKIWNWYANAGISGLSDNPAAIAGVIGAFATEAGGNTIDGLTPFSWSSWGGTLLGCIPAYCGDIKSKVTEAVGHDYFAYKTGVDGIPEEAVDKAIDLELKFIMNDFNGGTNWRTFVENLDVPTNKTPESYAELFEVIVQNAADSSGDAVQDEGIINWVSSHSQYSTVQQVLDKKRKLAREVYDKLADGDCAGKNPVVEVDGNKYMFPLAGATKDNYLGHGDRGETSVLSPMPCENRSRGVCHHDYYALDMGLRKKAVDGSEYTDSDFPDLSYGDEYYYSTGVKALAFVAGEITNYGCYTNVVPDGYDSACKCASIGFHGDDGIDYWIGHLSYDPKYKAGDRLELGDELGEVGPPPCAQGTQSHIHVDIQDGTDSHDPKIYDIMNAAYNALPETSGGASTGSCGDTSGGGPICDDPSAGSGGSGGGTVTAGGLDDAAAAALAAYYKSGGGTQCGGAQRESYYAFSMWFLCNFTSVVSEGTNACSGVPSGGEVVGCLNDRYGISTGYEPKPFAIFSVPNHTGVVVRVNDDGSYVTVEAAENDGVSYFGWNDTPGDGWARVFTHDSSYGASFAYVGDKVDMEKLNSVIGK